MTIAYMYHSFLYQLFYEMASVGVHYVHKNNYMHTYTPFQVHVMHMYLEPIRKWKCVCMLCISFNWALVKQPQLCSTVRMSY